MADQKTQDTKEAIDQLQSTFADYIETNLPEGQCRYSALYSLECAGMHARKALFDPDCPVGYASSAAHEKQKGPPKG